MESKNSMNVFLNDKGEGMNKKKIIVISGVSGVGKSEVINKIIKMNSNIVQARSDTTRNSRNDGKDHYRFVTKEEFIANLESGTKYLEHNFYGGNYYAINREELHRICDSGKIVLIDCNISGMQHLLEDEEFKSCILSFYLTVTPQKEYERLQKRNTEDQEMILMRMQEGVRDLVNASTGIYDYVIENREGEIDLVSSQIIELIEKQPKKSTTHDKALLIQRSLDQLLFCENLENQLKNSEEIHKSTFIF